MKQVQYTEYGDETVLKLVPDAPEPEPADGEILIKVAGSGVNPVDWKLRTHGIPIWPQQLPICPGWEASGTVEKAPAESGFKVGDKVYAYTRPCWDMTDTLPECKDDKIGLRDGTTAEKIAVAEWKVAPAPTSVDLPHAAGIPLAGLTAWQGLMTHLKADKGETVLILGASGGVGSFAVGFAKEIGCKVIGVCSGKNVDYVKSLGADVVIDYKKGPVQTQLADEKIDKVYDAVGGSSSADGIALCKPDGIILSIANFSIAEEAKAAGKTGVVFVVQPSGFELRKIAELIDAGKVKMPPVTTYPLAEVAKTHKLSQDGHTVGKMVLLP